MRVGSGVTMLLVLALGACTGDTEPAADGAGADTPGMAAPAPGAQEAAVPAGAIPVTLREWTIELGADSVAAGAISFAVTNAGSVAHAFEVEGGGEEWATQPIEPGGSLTMTVNLEPGEYRVYCPVEAGGETHESRGMVAQLRVH